MRLQELAFSASCCPVLKVSMVASRSNAPSQPRGHRWNRNALQSASRSWNTAATFKTRPVQLNTAAGVGGPKMISPRPVSEARPALQLSLARVIFFVVVALASERRCLVACWLAARVHCFQRAKGQRGFGLAGSERAAVCLCQRRKGKSCYWMLVHIVQLIGMLEVHVRRDHCKTVVYVL